MKESNKIKILKTLLESPKTTGEIAIELGYIDDKGYGRYNVVNPDLQTLEQYGFIHRIDNKEKRSGAPAKTYDIVYEYDNLIKLLIKYPNLISDLQKSDKIISMIVEKHKGFCIDKAKLSQEPAMIVTISQTEYTQAVEDLKKKLTLSSTFFELCLTNEPKDLHNKHEDIFWVFTGKPEDDEFIRKWEGHVLDWLFKACAISDILKGQKNDEIIKHVLDVPI